MLLHMYKLQCHLVNDFVFIDNYSEPETVADRMSMNTNWAYAAPRECEAHVMISSGPVYEYIKS